MPRWPGSRPAGTNAEHHRCRTSCPDPSARSPMVPYGTTSISMRPGCRRWRRSPSASRRRLPPRGEEPASVRRQARRARFWKIRENGDRPDLRNRFVGFFVGSFVGSLVRTSADALGTRAHPNMQYGPTRLLPAVETACRHSGKDSRPAPRRHGAADRIVIRRSRPRGGCSARERPGRW